MHTRSVKRLTWSSSLTLACAWPAPAAATWRWTTAGHVGCAWYTAFMLSFQKLDVSRCAIEFLALTAQAAEQIPRGNATLLDQLRRAASSLSLNIAEAAGRSGQADGARTDPMARGGAGRIARAEGDRCQYKTTRRRASRTDRGDAHDTVSMMAPTATSPSPSPSTLTTTSTSAYVGVGVALFPSSCTN